MFTLSFLKPITISTALCFMFVACAQTTKDADTAKAQKANSYKAPAKDRLLLRPEDFRSFEDDELAAFKLAEDTKSPFSHALFGFIDPEDPDSNFQVFNELPNKPGLFYGWALHIKSGGPSKVKVGERLSLPEPARVFRIDTTRSQVSGNGRVVDSSLELQSEHDWIFNFWQMTPGDPDGDYQIELTYGGTPLVNFEFKIGP